MLAYPIILAPFSLSSYYGLNDKNVISLFIELLGRLHKLIYMDYFKNAWHVLSTM
jgi:hypothetical protein